MFVGVIAVVVSLAAAALVYAGWRRSLAWAALCGWILAPISVPLWSRALGPEIGFVYAVILFICCAWVLVVINREPTRTVERSGQRPLHRPFQRLQWAAPQQCLHHGALFVLAVLVSGVSSMLVSVALVLYLPWTLPLKLAVAIFLYPLLWGALSVWVCAQDKLLQPLVTNLGLCAVSGLLLFL